MTFSFFKRIAAGPQHAESDASYDGDVTIYRTEDTSAPYPHYAHQPVTEYGQQADAGEYQALCDNHEAAQSAEVQQEASQLASSFFGRLFR